MRASGRQGAPSQHTKRWDMARPPRLEFSGAIYHVLACGNRRETTYRDDAYGEALGRLGGGDRRLREEPKAQRRPLAGSLAEYARRWPDRREAMAYRSGAYTKRECADHFGVHYMTVSRAVRHFERELGCEN